MIPEAPVLMVVTDPSIPDLMARVGEAIAGGAQVIQYRDKPASTAERIAWVDAFKARFPRTPVIVNDDLAAVEQSGADGLHMSSTYARDASLGRLSTPGRLLGRSVHSDAVDGASYRLCGLDYVLFGTVFPSETHPGGPVAGIDGLKAVAGELACEFREIPIVAIGGIDAANAAECIRVGACGVAVIRSVLLARDPARAAADILTAMRGAA